MSYVVSIRRDAAITVDELQSAVEADPEFSVETSTVQLADGVMELAWRPTEDADAECFVLSKGVIDVSTPSNSALRKMQAVAANLGAQVFGEEGEDLTDVEVADALPGGCGPAAWTVLLVLVLLAGYWLLS